VAAGHVPRAQVAKRRYGGGVVRGRRRRAAAAGASEGARRCRAVKVPERQACAGEAPIRPLPPLLLLPAHRSAEKCAVAAGA